MEFITDLLIQSSGKVWITFTHTWPYLLLSVLISVGLKFYTDPQAISRLLSRYSRLGVIGATTAAVTTPFCSCGTTAVVLGMIASTVPWAPIVAFMVSSPLSSPEGLFYSAGLFGWPFAIAFFASSILLGLLGGALAEFFEARGWLANQARFALQGAPSAQATGQKMPVQTAEDRACGCEAALQSVKQPIRAAQAELAPAFGGGAAFSTAAAACSCSRTPVLTVPEPALCGCGQTNVTPSSQSTAIDNSSPKAEAKKVTLRQWAEETYRIGGKLLLMFLGFAFIGYLLNGLIPTAWVAAVFGKGNIYSVPLAATLGLPLYINSEGSLPLVRALLDGGMSQGAAMAFLITGAGTSIGAMAGALTIARWRVIGLVVGTLWVGAIILGYAYNFLLAAHLF